MCYIVPSVSQEYIIIIYCKYAPIKIKVYLKIFEKRKYEKDLAGKTKGVTAVLIKLDCKQKKETDFPGLSQVGKGLVLFH